jgi:hypothetical protein
MNIAPISSEDIKADFEWVNTLWVKDIEAAERKVKSLPMGSEERLEASINLAELTEIYEDDYFGY